MSFNPIEIVLDGRAVKVTDCITTGWIPKLVTENGDIVLVAPTLEWARDRLVDLYIRIASTYPDVFAHMADNGYFTRKKLPWGDSSRYLSERFERYRRNEIPLWSVYFESERDWDDLLRNVRDNFCEELRCKTVSISAPDLAPLFGFVPTVAFVPAIKGNISTYFSKMYESDFFGIWPRVG